MFRCCLRGLCSGSVRNVLTAMWYLLALSGLGLSYVLLPSGPALAQTYSCGDPEPPRVSWRLGLLGDGHQGWGPLIVVDGLELGGRDHADLPVEPSLVEPVHVLESGVFDVVESPPGSVGTNHLRLVEPVERFGQGVVVAIPAGAHGRHHAGVGEALRIADRQILHPAVRVVDEAIQVRPAAGPDGHL